MMKMFLATIALALFTQLVDGATFVVENSDDFGPGSLRQAILDNNASPSATVHLIQFNIPSPGTHQIYLNTELPAITQKVRIDGYTQPGASANTLSTGNNAVIQIEIVAAFGVESGLKLHGGPSIIRGLALTYFSSNAVEVAGVGGHVVEGSFIGVSADGSSLAPNGHAGIKIDGSPGNRVGGTTPASRNIIAGNGAVEVLISGIGASNNVVQGNFLGVDRSGELDLGANTGVHLADCRGNLVGGEIAGAGNVISGQNAYGILINGTSFNNKVLGNRIGTDSVGDTRFGLGNGEGVFIDAAASGGNQIGGTAAGQGNVIRFNLGRGIQVASGTSFAIRGNAISDNGGLGIDLEATPGVSANDPGDADGGANQLQNFPVLTSAQVTANNVVVQGSLNSRAGAAVSLDFFSSPRRDSSGHGEAHKYLGTTNLITDGSGNIAFTVGFTSVPAGRYITATATDSDGNTSEFSAAIPAAAQYPTLTFTVTTVNDGGSGSLRQAILDGNTVTGNTNVTIAFNIPGAGPHVIAPLSRLPAIERPTLIDGYTQPGASANTASNGFNAVLKIRLEGDGSLSEEGLWVSGDLSVIRGISFTHSGLGIVLSGYDHRVEGCLGGLTESGVIRPNGIAVSVFDGSGHVIGGVTPAARNVLSGNASDGIRLEHWTGGCTIQGNFIGVNFTGDAGVANGGFGIRIGGAGNNLIGGTMPGARNVVSGNFSDGIGVFGPENRIAGNYIGLNAAGTASIPNRGFGINVSFAALNVIGGATTAARNVISGNGQPGITLAFSGAASNRVIGNFIGTDASGNHPVPNAYGGVRVSGDNNSIGGAAGEENRIAFNIGSGITIIETNNAIRRNEIFNNSGLGIDLGGGGSVIANDAGDGDDGPNHLQNFPELAAATITAATTRIQGSLSSSPGTSFALDFFASPAADPSGHGEGRQYLGSTNVTTSGGGSVSFDVTFAVPAAGRHITATATDPDGNTSQFSQALRAVSTIAPRTFTVVNTNDSGAGSLRQALLDSGDAPASGNHTIAFAIPGTNFFVISLLSPLPGFNEAVTVDAFTQSAAAPGTATNADNAVRKIRVSGANAGEGTDAFQLTQPGTVLRGLEITGFGGRGVWIASGGNKVEGCHIFSNALSGILISNASGNLIGGSTPAKRNVISGNTGPGIEVLEGAANAIQGNFIGSTASGSFGVPNGGAGISLLSAAGNAVSGNVIGANLQGGIEILGSDAVGNLVQANLIGATPDGSNLGNANGGIILSENAHSNIIGEPRGSTGTVLGNLIAYNQQDGIYATSGSNNTFRANRIFENAHLGIDLEPNAVNANDNTDSDIGANLKQNFPLVTNALLTASHLKIQGTLNSRPSTSYQVDFFRNVLCDPSLHGEGEYFIGTAFITTDLSGNAVFNVNVPGNNGVGTYVTCTATDPAGNTSEFSPCTQMASELPPQTFLVTTTANAGAGSLRAAITAANAVASALAHNILFAIAGSGVHTIEVNEELPELKTSMNLDGFSQQGWGPGNPVIQVLAKGAAVKRPVFWIQANNSTIKGIQVSGSQDCGTRVENARNTLITDCIFGSEVESESIQGDAIQFIASCDRSKVSDNIFLDIGGHCVTAPASTILEVRSLVCESAEGLLVYRHGFGGPGLVNIQVAECQEENAFRIQGQCTGPANTQGRVDLSIVRNGSPLSSSPLLEVTVNFDGSGIATFSLNTPRTPGTIGVNATQTHNNNNTSSSSPIKFWNYCESLIEDYLSTALNTPQSGVAGDPISTFSGELYDALPPDLSLGGPMPLYFQRFYGSRLVADAKITSKLGENWLHNFDMKLSNKVGTVEVVLAQGMFLRFTNQGGVYSLMNRQDLHFQLRATNADFVVSDTAAARFFTFANSGRLTKIEDGRGNAHTLSYIGANLNTVTDGLGRTLTCQYNAGGAFLVSVTDGTRSVSFTQAANLLLTASTPLGFTTTNVYSGSDTNFPAPYTSLLEKMIRPETNSPLFQYWNAVGGVSAQLHGSGAWSLRYFGDITQVLDPLGYSVLQAHNSNGWLTAWTDEAGRTIGMRYDSSGRRTDVTNRLGHVVSLGYDNNDRIVALTNELGRVTTFAYTNLLINGFTVPKLRLAAYRDGTSEQFLYDASGNPIVYVDRAGQSSRFSYNHRGQVLAATNALGGTVSFTYNADGTLASRHDPETGFTVFGYDPFKRLTSVTHPDLTTRRWVYDADGRLTSFTDERTNTTTFAYDRNGRLTNRVDAAGKTNRYAYDESDRFSRAVDRLGNVSSRSYDPRGLVSTVTDKNGFSTQFRYDPRQRLTRVVEPGNITSEFAYDAEARLTSSTNQNREVTRIGRDATGLVISQTNALGHVNSFQRDAMGRITNRIDQLGRFFGYRFDQRGLLTNVSHPGIGTAGFHRNALGQLTHISDLNGRQWSFGYSPMGRLQSASDPLSRTNRYSYDNRGRLQQTTFADGSSATNTFDGANNLTRRRFSDGTDMQFAYDQLNRVTNAGGTTFAYDAEGRLLSEQSAGLTVNAAYDAGGRVTNLTYHGLFSVNYVYDSRGRLESVQDTLTGTELTFRHDAAGRLRFIHRPNNLRTTYSYDAAGRMTRIQDGNFSTNLIDIAYTIDAAGQITAANFHAPLDPSDAVSLNTNTFSYDSAHQVSTAGYAYDARGRLRNRPGNTFTFDGASRLTQIDGVALGYDALNALVTRTQGGVTTRFVHARALARSPIIAERNQATSQFMRFYVWAPNGTLLYMIDAANGNAVRFYHFDRVGTTLALTDETGAVTDAYAWTPYGELLARTGTNQQPFTYVGRFGVRAEPAGNFFHMRARYFDPMTARFLSRDPVWPRLGEPQSLNPYEYSSAQPLRYVDPNGGKEETPEAGVRGLAGRNASGVNPKASLVTTISEPIKRSPEDDYIIRLVRPFSDGPASFAEEEDAIPFTVSDVEAINEEPIGDGAELNQRKFEWWSDTTPESTGGFVGGTWHEFFPTRARKFVVSVIQQPSLVVSVIQQPPLPTGLSTITHESVNSEVLEAILGNYLSYDGMAFYSPAFTPPIPEECRMSANLHRGCAVDFYNPNGR